MKNLISVFAVVFIILSSTKALAAKDILYVSIPPQKYIVERIVGDAYDVKALLGPNQSPHTFEIAPKELVDLSKARLYFTIGLPFEKRIAEKMKSINRAFFIIDPTTDIKRISTDDHHNHHHHDGSECGDPHIWLSIDLMKKIASQVSSKMGLIDPKNKSAYEQNLKNLISELSEIDIKIGNSFKQVQKRNFYIYHPALTYFAKDYNLNQIPIEQAGKSPRSKQLIEIIEMAKRDRTKIIFVEPQSPQKEMDVIASEIGARIERINPMEYNFINNVVSISNKIYDALN